MKCLVLTSKDVCEKSFAEIEQELEPRESWLCGCGNGRLSVPVSQIPDFCGVCGSPVAFDDFDQDDF